MERIRQDFCELDAPQGTVVAVTTTARVPGKLTTVENPLFVGRS